MRTDVRTDYLGAGRRSAWRLTADRRRDDRRRGADRGRIRAARTEIENSYPAGRPAAEAGGGFIRAWWPAGLHRIDDGTAVAAVPAATAVRLPARRGRRDDHAVAIGHHADRTDRRHAVGSLSGRYARRHRHGDRNRRISVARLSAGSSVALRPGVA